MSGGLSRAVRWFKVRILIYAALRRECKFEGDDDDSSLYHISPEFENPHVVSLPHLLTANVSVPGYGAYLLRSINAPKLTYINLDGRGINLWHNDDGDGGWDLNVISTLFSITVHRLSARSRNLRRLRLECTKFHSPLEDYTLILSGAGFPQLEELELIDTDINDAALLAAGNGSGSSSLKKLTLQECLGVTGRGLLGFVRGRRSDFRLSLYRCRYLTQQEIVALSAVVNVYYVQ